MVGMALYASSGLVAGVRIAHELVDLLISGLLRAMLGTFCPGASLVRLMLGLARSMACSRIYGAC